MCLVENFTLNSMTKQEYLQLICKYVCIWIHFFYIQLPWKTLKNLVEYYYMWKTTDRYVQQKRVKAVEAESKLKQVYIPN